MEKETKKTPLDSGFFEQVMADMKNAVLVFGSGGEVLYANKSAKRLLEKKDFSNTTLARIMQENTRAENDAFFECILDVVYNKERQHQRKVPYVSDSGKEYIFHVTSSFVPEEEVHKRGVVITIADETKADTLAHKRRDAVVVLVSFCILICVTCLVTEVNFILGEPYGFKWISRFIELGAFALLFVTLKFTSFSVEEMGLRPMNLKKDMKESVLISVGMVLALIAAKDIALRLGVSYFDPSTPFFDWRAPGSNYLVYIIVVFAQEFLAHCLMQENITRILEGKTASLRAIAISSCMFMGLHTHLGPSYMVGSAVLMFALGFIYQRHRHLFGTALIHYCFGIAGTILHWT